MSTKDTEPPLIDTGLSPIHNHNMNDLSNKDLLTIILSSHKNTGVLVNTLLKAFRGNLKDLFTATVEDLLAIDGISLPDAYKIKAVFELGKRITSSWKGDHPLITSTDDVVLLMAPSMIYLRQEEFRVLLLDTKNQLLSYHKISLGTLDETVVHPRDVFRPAITHAAASIILLHNHPSGDAEPSEANMLLTRELLMCSQVLDIPIIDHIIIAKTDVTSMKKRNLL
jgi:DNA repair protein RadC